MGHAAAATRLAGERAGWCALIATALLPYHWLFPASLRWYALFAALAVWNFVVFLEMRSAVSRGRLAAYVVTGSLMWYTNYAAPLYFAGHLAIVLLWDRPRLRLVRWLAIAWLLIVAAYAPWLAVFLRQLPISIGMLGETWRSLPVLALNLYVLWAGEFSTPFAWRISLPAALTAACAMLWFARQPPPRPGRLPAAMLLLLIAGLSLAGVLWTKRLLLVSPFLAMWLGTTVAARPRRFVSVVFALAAIAAVAGSAGSARNAIARDGWISYRWLDPIDEVSRGIRQAEPAGMLLTNAYPVLFYLHTTCGLPLGRCEDASRVVFRDFSDPQPSWASGARLPARVSYLHHSATMAFGSIAAELERRLAQD